MFKSRTGIDIPHQYHIKRATRAHQKTNMRDHLGTLINKMDNVDRKAIFEFDFDPRIYRYNEPNGK